MDPSAKAFLKALEFSNRRGFWSGSRKDGPEIREVVVAPLWRL